MINKKQYSAQIEIPEGVSINLDGPTINVNGPQGSTHRKLAHPKININLNATQISLSTLGNVSKREKKMLNTFEAHIKNMVGGVTKPYNYKLKICSGHFPMNVSIDKDTILIKNFLGEKIPRKVNVLKNVDVNINGDFISVSSVDKELAGKMSSRLEQATRITNRDRRRFMDGLWIIEKGMQNE